MRKCSSSISYAACTFRPYKSTPVLKLFRTFTGRMTRGLSLRMVFSLLFQDTLLIGATTGSSCGCSIKSRSEEKQRDGEGRQGIPEHLERLHPRPGRQTGECMLYVVQSSTVVQ